LAAQSAVAVEPPSCCEFAPAPPSFSRKSDTELLRLPEGLRPIERAPLPLDEPDNRPRVGGRLYDKIPPHPEHPIAADSRYCARPKPSGLEALLADWQAVGDARAPQLLPGRPVYLPYPCKP
jgi:hypothetical protein